MKLCLQCIYASVFFIVLAQLCHASAAIVNVSSTRVDSVFVDGIYAGQAPLRVRLPYGVHTFSCGGEWKKVLIESGEECREIELYPVKWASTATKEQKDAISGLLAKMESVHLPVLWSRLRHGYMKAALHINDTLRIDGRLYVGMPPVTLLRTLVTKGEWNAVFNKRPTEKQLEYADHEYFYDIAVQARMYTDVSAFVTRLNDLTGVCFALPDSIDLVRFKVMGDYKEMTTRKTGRILSMGSFSYYSAGSNELDVNRSICANMLMGEYTSENGSPFSFKKPNLWDETTGTGAFRLKISMLRADDKTHLVDLTGPVLKARNQKAERERELFRLSLDKAEHGDAEAMAVVGSYYHLGIGTSCDDEKAVAWDIRAAEAGSQSGANHLAYYSKWAVSPKLREGVAPAIYRYYAERGDSFYKAALSECYFTGFGVSHSTKTAKEWAQEAEGTTYGEYMLGLCLLDENDEAEALKHFLNAVNNRDNSFQQGKAFYRLGLMAEKEGEDISATVLQKGAYLLDVPEGYMAFAGRLSKRRGCMRDEATAVAIYYEYFQKVLASFDEKARCAFEIGKAYQQGNGVPQNDSLCINWYGKAADMGHAGAHYYLGNYYMFKATDSLRALEHYSIAAEMGNRNAMDKMLSYYKKAGDRETVAYWAERMGEDVQKVATPTKEEADRALAEQVRSLFHWEGSEAYLGKDFDEVMKRYGRKSAESAVAAFYRSYKYPVHLTDMANLRRSYEWLEIVKACTPRNSEKYAGICQWMGAATGRIISYVYKLCGHDQSSVGNYIQRNQVVIRTCLELSKMCFDESITAYTSIGKADSEECIVSKLSLAYVLFHLSEFDECTKQLQQALSSLRRLSIREVVTWTPEQRIIFCRKWSTQLTMGAGAYICNEEKYRSVFSGIVFDAALMSKGLLSDLERNTPDGKDLERMGNVSWRQVQAQLNDGEAAIEILRSFHELTGKPFYRAVVLRHKGKPVHIDMGFEEHLLKYFGNGLTYTSDLTYKVFWEKLEPYIRDCRTVYYVPDGIFYQLQMEAVPFDGDTFVDEHWNIVRLSSTGQLLQPRESSSYGNPLLVGGLNYGTEATFPSMALRGGVSNLPESITEVENIAAQMQAVGRYTTMLTGDEGDEQTVSKAMEGKNLIHIATHGYYWTSAEQRLNRSLPFMREAKDDDLSMLSSGLMVAGVNRTLRNRREDIDVAHDGFLTSKEISRIDLSDASLVVLSACQSGVGKVSSSGIDGLQRALKVAGAKSLLLSLWKVDDRATRLFMEEFYRQLLSGQTKPAALKAARQYLRNYSEITLEGLGHIRIKPYERPFYWAAFVLIDAIE